jgi:hypothetical protein
MHDVSEMAGQAERVSGPPGRTCPLRYRYAPASFRSLPPLRVETAYVVGGLYGNLEALREVLAMKRREEDRTGRPVTLVYNGDFNWFDIEPEDFVEINETVLSSPAIQGNVEAELEGEEGGCGCNYPEHVAQAVVDRSNAIMRRLQAAAKPFPDLVRRLGALPMQRVLDVAGARVGVVHGDAASLSGWGFAAESIPGDAAAVRITGWFREADVVAFCSTHTGLPVVGRFQVDGADRLVINNGAAGLPNFGGDLRGVITRLATTPAAPADRLYGARIAHLYFDALGVAYDQAAWLARFRRSWPKGSPAAESYEHRIVAGPDFTVAEADRFHIAA